MTVKNFYIISNEDDSYYLIRNDDNTSFIDCVLSYSCLYDCNIEDLFNFVDKINESNIYNHTFYIKSVKVKMVV